MTHVYATLKGAHHQHGAGQAGFPRFLSHLEQGCHSARVDGEIVVEVGATVARPR